VSYCKSTVDYCYASSNLWTSSLWKSFGHYLWNYFQIVGCHKVQLWACIGSANWTKSIFGRTYKFVTGTGGLLISCIFALSKSEPGGSSNVSACCGEVVLIIVLVQRLSLMICLHSDILVYKTGTAEFFECSECDLCSISMLASLQHCTNNLTRYMGSKFSRFSDKYLILTA
jgi:hypothetical protein